MACSEIAGSSLEQTTWLRRNLMVKPGRQLDVQETEDATDHGSDGEGKAGHGHHDDGRHQHQHQHHQHRCKSSKARGRLLQADRDHNYPQDGLDWRYLFSTFLHLTHWGWNSMTDISNESNTLVFIQAKFNTTQVPRFPQRNLLPLEYAKLKIHNIPLTMQLVTRPNYLYPWQGPVA